MAAGGTGEQASRGLLGSQDTVAGHWRGKGLGSSDLQRLPDFVKEGSLRAALIGSCASRLVLELSIANSAFIRIVFREGTVVPPASPLAPIRISITLKWLSESLNQG